MKIVVVDYCGGNLRSVQKGLELAGAEALISAEAEELHSADALVLPGVGSFGDASATLLATGQMQALRECIAAGTPFLGICLGMQLLLERGDEGMPTGQWAEGLGIFEGSCKKVAATDEQGTRYKVPHVGWNQVTLTTAGRHNTSSQQLFNGIAEGSHFYFTHSYQCEVSDTDGVTALTQHAECFPSVLCKEQVFGVQFHPEKSSRKGLALMKNFVEIAESR